MDMSGAMFPYFRIWYSHGRWQLPSHTSMPRCGCGRSLAIDTEVCAVIEYFEIFMDRMLLCRRAAEKLGLHFALVINGQRMA